MLTRRARRAQARAASSDEQHTFRLSVGQVDDLDEGRGAEMLDASLHVVLFLTDGFFRSVNCMRELLRAVFTTKPITVLLDPNATHGALMWDDIRPRLAKAFLYLDEWGLSEELEEWQREAPETALPTLQSVLVAMEQRTTLEWSRIPAYHEVALKAMAEQVLEPRVGSFARRSMRSIFADRRSSHRRTDRPSDRRTSEQEPSRKRQPTRTLTVAATGSTGSAGTPGCSQPAVVATPAGKPAGEGNTVEKRASLAGAPAGFLVRMGQTLGSSYAGAESSLVRMGQTLGAGAESAERTYLKSELPRKMRRFKLPQPRNGRVFHLFCSQHNAGAKALLAELREACALEVQWTSDRCFLKLREVEPRLGGHLMSLDGPL